MTPPPTAEKVFGDQLGLAAEYAELLAGRGVEWGLLGPREMPRIWERHVLNSYALADVILPGSSLVDVGTGAGLPGIPLAIGRPDLRVTLLEPLLRRVKFLEAAVQALGLGDRVEVRRGRAEDASGAFDVVASRAVAPLGRLAGWCVPLMARDGVVLALKGQNAAAELEEAALSLRKLGVRGEVLTLRAHPDLDETHAVRLFRAPG